MWEVVLVATLYRREIWLGGNIDPSMASDEELFTARVKGPNCPGAMSRALAECSAQAESWLRRKGASLVTHVVVTVYSLEVS